jgi:rhodanese-related sulfurtransferase
MIGKVLNLPFKVLGGVARAVQAQEAKKRTQENDQNRGPETPLKQMDIQVPDDFDAGPLRYTEPNAVHLVDTGCIVDATAEGHGIPKSLHIPMRDIGIRIAELPPETTILVITDNPSDGDQIVRFLRHRGLDETWSLDGGIEGWRQSGGPVGEPQK